MRHRLIKGSNALPAIAHGEHYHAMHSTLPDLSVASYLSAVEAASLVSQWAWAGEFCGFKVEHVNEGIRVDTTKGPAWLYVEACTDKGCPTPR